MATERATRAASFAGVADAYDRGRPGYAAAAIEWLLGPRPLRVADLGAGTGKLTEALVRAGHQVIAVEPLDEMRAILRRRVPAAVALPGRAESIPLPDDSVDAVVAGAAFHWFERDPALREIARVLAGPEILGLLGNSFDTSVEWVARLREALGPAHLGRPGHWPEPDELASGFAEVDVAEFEHAHEVTLALLLDLARSRSGIAVLDERGRSAVVAAIERLWREDVGADRSELPYRTRVMRAGRLVPRGVASAAA